jgi:hypothetical protein
MALNLMWTGAWTSMAQLPLFRGNYFTLRIKVEFLNRHRDGLRGSTPRCSL